MSMLRVAIVSGLLVSGLAAIAQTEAPAQQADRQKSMVKDPVQGGWYLEAAANEETLLLLDAITTSPVQGLDELRSTRNAALSRNNGYLTTADQEHLDRAATSLNTAYPNTFEAHMANYYARFPQPTAFAELELAAAASPERSELVAPRLLAAARSDDRAALAKRARDMKQRGEVAPGLYSYADDLLRSVDDDGILIAAGEMDAYPSWVRQYAESKRPDLLVIDRRLLSDPEYRARMWERSEANGPVPSDEAGFIAALHRSTGRPVYLSLAVGSEVARHYAGQLSVTGLAMRMSEGASGDLEHLATLWKQMNKRTDAGPIAANYLVPGSLLLKHYRAVQDEEKANELEAELRIMAERLGATKAMYTNGIFLH